EDRPRTVAATMETGLQFSKLIGILWPLDLFKNAVNRDPKPAEISKFTVSGSNLVGVLRDPKHGEPPGTTRIEDFRRSFGSNSMEVANSKDAISSGE
ncbi:unnamed protein product, partial [Effrenium voratum]